MTFLQQLKDTGIDFINDNYTETMMIVTICNPYHQELIDLDGTIKIDFLKMSNGNRKIAGDLWISILNNGLKIPNTQYVLQCYDWCKAKIIISTNIDEQLLPDNWRDSITRMI